MKKTKPPKQQFQQAAPEAYELPAPSAVISRRAADRLRAGHLWVYQSDIEALPGVAMDAPPSLLPVADGRGVLLGTALFSPASQITLRLVSRELLEDEGWLNLFRGRIRQALALRARLGGDSPTTGGRLIFSEADALPGLVVDRYGELILVQILARGLDRPEIRAALVEELRLLKPAAILERPDPRISQLEGIPAAGVTPLYVEDSSRVPMSSRFLLNGLSFGFDASSGQKTGAFLDQRQNYAAAARYAHGEALDVCCYQGGFALHLARACQRVTGVDVSRAALEVAEQNLAANQAQLTAEVDWVEADAFDLLRDWSTAGSLYDTIVLDPPAFAKSKRAVEGALRGYKELNLRALRMLRPGGTLVTCSCSHHVSPAEFEAIVSSAAADARRRVRLVERRSAAEDHPVLLTLPETDYLKCLICEVQD